MLLPQEGTAMQASLQTQTPGTSALKPGMPLISELHFLVVEDHGFQRWAVGNALSSIGAKHVYSAPDGHTALTMFRNREPPIDILITDLDMPDMDGMEMLRRVRECGSPVSVILVSSLKLSLIASVGSMATAYGIDLLGAIEKPVTAEKLAQAMKDYKPAARAAEISQPQYRFPAEEISRGLKRDEFEPYFEPKIDLATGQIVGAEAVARWNHPSRGLLHPESFIESLDHHGLLDELALIMVNRAAACCHAWRDANLEATVSVNLSIKSVADFSLTDCLLDVVEANGLKPRDVIFEVTESVAATKLGTVLENLSRLCMKGFGLSIADYGTGHVTLQEVARIAFTELKIAPSFVKNASTQPSSRAIVESSIEMAGMLGIVAVAEGVESQADWDLLRALGCQLAQGNFIGKPMDAVDFLEWIRVRGFAK
jgi:EAL domain-containing protein (putative c-di-GMP-specific phosphodiesterase class I)/CheY-like chemotaxis protein